MSDELIYKDEAIQVLENRLAAHDAVIGTLNFGSNAPRSQRRHEVAECIEDIRAIPLAVLREPESVVSPDREIINRAIARIQENCEGGAPVRTSLSILDDLLDILAAPTSLDDRVEKLAAPPVEPVPVPRLEGN